MASVCPSSYLWPLLLVASVGLIQYLWPLPILARSLGLMCDLAPYLWPGQEQGGYEVCSAPWLNLLALLCDLAPTCCLCLGQEEVQWQWGCEVCSAPWLHLLALRSFPLYLTDIQPFNLNKNSSYKNNLNFFHRRNNR